RRGGKRTRKIACIILSKGGMATGDAMESPARKEARLRRSERDGAAHEISSSACLAIPCTTSGPIPSVGRVREESNSFPSAFPLQRGSQRTPPGKDTPMTSSTSLAVTMAPLALGTASADADESSDRSPKLDDVLDSAAARIRELVENFCRGPVSPL